MPGDALIKGADHIGLTVPDLEKAKAFFIDTLGFEQVGGIPDYPSAFVSNGNIRITLWQAADPANAVPFDRKNVIGLHHLALGVENADVLDNLHETLKASDGVDIEFAPESLMGTETKHMMCAIPGGIRVEFIARA